MKKFMIGALLAVASMNASAAFYYENYYGMWVSNFCRAGQYYLIMPVYRPVGEQCYIDAYGSRWFGHFTME